MKDDLLDWVADLPRLTNYTANDQYRDFRKVFMGTDEGRRVLRKIMEEGAIFQQAALISPIDPLKLAASAGRRHLALKIISIINDEPKAQPKQAVRKKPVILNRQRHSGTDTY